METNDLIKRIRHLEIKAKGWTKHLFAGEYHSAFKGRGMTFSEVRNYQFGDEVRTIDWNVTARYNEPYSKVFEEERELTVLLVMDVSGSNEFGTAEKSKKELALELAAVLAFSAISNNDRVGVLLVSDRVERYIAPAKGRKHALLILREMIECTPKSKLTNLNEGLQFLRNTQKKRSIVIVISDFIDNTNFLDGMRLTRKRHDTIAIKLSDPAEYKLPNMGLIQLVNAETGTTTWVNSATESVRQHIEQHFIAHENETLNALKKIGVDVATCSTTEDLILPLKKLFKQRS